MPSPIEIVPAILAYSKEELSSRLSSVSECPILQLDLMDGKFVGNTTIGLDDLENYPLPDGKLVEYHLMVSDPLVWIEKLPAKNPTIFQVHVESLMPLQSAQEGRPPPAAAVSKIRQAVQARGKHCSLAFALNPPTPLSCIEPFLSGIPEVLIMTVHPGWSGQKYIPEMEKKMHALCAAHPGLIIEIDGGVDFSNAKGAVLAGAGRLAAASALFKRPNPQEAYYQLRALANEKA